MTLHEYIHYRRLYMAIRCLLNEPIQIKSLAEQFLDAAAEHGAQVICCSTLLTTTMFEMENVVKEAAARGVRDNLFIMVGGAPLSDAFCEKIGADCYMPDAASAADAALAWLKEKNA